MAWFIKTETFSQAFRALPGPERGALLQAHRTWVEAHRALDLPIASGFLVDQQRQAGGGGLLLLQAGSYSEALALIEQDPLIAAGWVDWQLHEWIAAAGDLSVAPVGREADPSAPELSAETRA